MLQKLFCLVSLFIGADASAQVVDCSSGSSLFKITKLDLSPQDIKSGSDVILTLLYTNPGPPIISGTVNNQVTYNFIPFQSTSEPLCDSAKCPIVTGFNNGTAVSVWPNLSGTVISTLTWLSNVNEVLLCLKMTVKTMSNQLIQVPNPEEKQVAQTRMFRRSLLKNPGTI